MAVADRRRAAALDQRTHPSGRVDALVPSERARARGPLERRLGAVAGLKEATATSAGGVVVRYEAGIPRFVAGRRNDVRTWTLPKGTPLIGEATEETALREVTEETGLEVRIVDSLDLISYTFAQRGTRIHKTVFYFLMEPTGGDLSRHDHEFDDVRWFDIAEAGGVLTFESERGLVERAAERLAGRAASASPPAVGSEPAGSGA